MAAAQNSDNNGERAPCGGQTRRDLIQTGAVLVQRGQRVLILAHRHELLEQNTSALLRLRGSGKPGEAKNDTDKLLVINVWATWCGPCVTELPEFVTMNRMYRRRDFELVTISIDEPEQQAAALKLLRAKHVAATNYISSVSNRDKLADLLDKEWDGPMPYTLLVAPGGKIIYRKSNQIEPLEVRRAIVEFLGRTYANRPAVPGS
jgi:thiol-disulfide isomerase/thioredoxin